MYMYVNLCLYIVSVFGKRSEPKIDTICKHRLMYVYLNTNFIIVRLK